MNYFTSIGNKKAPPPWRGFLHPNFLYKETLVGVGQDCGWVSSK
jgi:hypothetical protein